MKYLIFLLIPFIFFSCWKVPEKKIEKNNSNTWKIEVLEKSNFWWGNWTPVLEKAGRQ